MFDKDRSYEDVSQTFHTYENALKDKDEEDRMNKDIIREQNTTIDNLKCNVQEVKGNFSDFISIMQNGKGYLFVKCASFDFS